MQHWKRRIFFWAELRGIRPGNAYDGPGRDSANSEVRSSAIVANAMGSRSIPKKI